jgi:hypothetical protein
LATQSAFRPDDPDLGDVVVLDFAAFGWWEEDAQIIGHPRDPFHRIDVWPSTRHIEIALEGMTLEPSSTSVTCGCRRILLTCRA